MTVIGEAFIEVKPKTEGFDKDVTSKVGGIAKKAAGLVAGAFAAQQGVQFFKGIIADAEESRKVAAQTAAAIKSTGGVARVTAGDVDALANAISRKTGIDDEAIASASNLLLTFTNVRNETGKGNDVFNQATRTLTDMSAALGGDVSGSAIQLGKALNDPITGITALTRVGVTFTDQQKEQIKAMVEAGDTAGAQKIILTELNKEFGGSAEAQATAGKKLSVAWGNIREDLGAKLLPVVDKVASFLADRLPGAMDAAGRAGDRLVKFVTPIVRVVGRVFEAFKLLTGDDGPQAFGEVMDNLLGNSGKYVGFFRRLGEVILDVVAFVRQHLRPILLGLAAVFVAVTSPITAVIAALVLLYTRFDGVREVVNAVASFLARTFSSVLDFAQEVWPQVAEAVEHAVNVIRDVVTVVLGVVQAAWRLFGDDILKIVRGAFDAIRAYVEMVINVVAGIIRFVLAVINGDWGKAWDALRGIVVAVWDGIKGIVSGALTALTGIIGGLMAGVGRAFSAAWEGIKGAARGGIDAIVGFVRDLPGRVLGLAGSIAGAFSDLGGKMLEGLTRGISGLGAGALGLADKAAELIGRMAKGLLNGVIQAINDMIPNSIGKVTVLGKTIFPGLDLPDNPIPKLASGAIVRSTPGGVVANIGEGVRDEAVLPLPPGLLAAMDRIAAGDGLGGPSIVLQVPPEFGVPDAVAIGREAIRQLRAESWRNGR